MPHLTRFEIHPSVSKHQFETRDYARHTRHNHEKHVPVFRMICMISWWLGPSIYDDWRRNVWEKGNAFACSRHSSFRRKVSEYSTVIPSNILQDQSFAHFIFEDWVMISKWLYQTSLKTNRSQVFSLKVEFLELLGGNSFGLTRGTYDHPSDRTGDETRIACRLDLLWHSEEIVLHFIQVDLSFCCPRVIFWYASPFWLEPAWGRLSFRFSALFEVAVGQGRRRAAAPSRPSAWQNHLPSRCFWITAVNMNPSSSAACTQPYQQQCLTL